MAGKRNPEKSLGLVIPVGFLEEEEPGLGFEGMARRGGGEKGKRGGGVQDGPEHVGVMATAGLTEPLWGLRNQDPAGLPAWGPPSSLCEGVASQPLQEESFSSKDHI